MNTDTGVKYPINRKWYLNSRLRYAILERLIADYAESIRGLKYSENDKSIVKITNGLIKEGIPYTEKSGSYVFSFERSPIETRVDTIKDTPDLKELTLGEFVAISNDMAKKELDEGAGMVVELMKELFAKEVPESKEPLTVYLNEDRNIKNLEDPKDMEYTRIDDESKLKISKKTKKSKKVVEKTRKVKKAAVVDVKATKVEDVKTTGVDEIKAMRRTTKTSFTNDRISLTTVTNNYLIGHATHADLSLFKDFDIWKEELDIVGKSFVTRGKPILINGCNVYVRDTMLLTSENQKSLGAISKMYGERLMKIKLPEGTYEDMNKFLEEDPEGFKAYGERDAVIPLIHAFNMENRNFILGNTTVPLTISSMSGNYIKDH
jgi:hypothetical protein